MSEPVLRVRDLSVTLSRDGRPSQILDGVTFDLAPGEILAVVGESGSGKSTMGFAIQGLLPPDSRPHVTGSIHIADVGIVGAEPAVLRKARRQLVRAIPQDPMGALDPTMVVRRQMAESMGSEELIVDWLTRCGLANAGHVAEALPHRLSGGQRQRVLIAMAMMAGPKLLIADEPTTALDVTTQAQILDLLRSLAREQNAAILYITHDLGVASSFADRLLVLYAGRTAETGSIREILSRPAHPYSAGLLASRFDLHSDRRRPLPAMPMEINRLPEVADACAFASRCALARMDCKTARPQLRESSVNAGSVACFHAEETPLLAAHAPANGSWSVPTIGKGMALTLSGVTKSFATGPRFFRAGRRLAPVLKGLDLHVREGESVALVGESGAGKTTALRIAAGLLAPDTGEVARADTSPQVVFQDAVSSLTPWLTIGEQIGERLSGLAIGRSERERRVRDALESVGLDHELADALPGELSGGQCQRAGVARAIIVPPKLLICDEPISATDVSLASTLLNLLGDLRRRLGLAILFVTHDLAAARIVADRIAVLRDGSVIEIGDADEIVANPKAAYTRALIAAVPHLAEDVLG
jgi:peptide/nickel transport system ATP-binding protein